MKKLILFILIVIFSGGILYSSIQIVIWMGDNQETTKQIEDIQNLVVVEEKESDSETIIAEESPHIEEKFINVDFEPLINTNREVAGWIQVKGTNINYPFVQHSDNSYYLKHSFDKSYNSAGWVFLDYRNTMNDLDTNTIIYAHGRVDGTMFGTLKNTLSSEWLSNPENAILKISTPFHNYLFEVFSLYHIKTTSDYLYNNFDSDEEYMAFIEKIKGRSVHNFPVEVTPFDKIVTLSTCYNNTEKMVLHAKLIKKEARY